MNKLHSIAIKMIFCWKFDMGRKAPKPTPVFLDDPPWFKVSIRRLKQYWTLKSPCIKIMKALISETW